MTGRAVDAPLERLYEELRRLRRIAGDVSYGYIARKNARGLSKTTVAAIFTGQGRKKPPRWEYLACVYDVLHAVLTSTGVATDGLGSKQALYQLYLRAVDAPQPAEPNVPGVESDVLLGQEPDSVLLPGPGATIPASAPAGDPPASLPAAPAGAVPAPLPASEPDARAVSEPDARADGSPWPKAEDLPGTPVPDDEELAALVSPGLALDDLHQPSCPRLARSERQGAQPVEQEATFAVLSASPRGQATANRMRSWFGPGGPALLGDAENDHAVAAFKLGVLLINNDAPQEGRMFLQRAAALCPKFTLTLPDLAVRDRLCGAIVADICGQIAGTYRAAGLPAMAERWERYIATIDTTFPLAVLFFRRTQPVGRHAREVSHDLVRLEDSELNRISASYWAVHTAVPAPQPSDGPERSGRWKPLWSRAFTNHKNGFWKEITPNGIKAKPPSWAPPAGG